jgi:phosphoribosylformylglycinamidine cyclo-ligase
MNQRNNVNVSLHEARATGIASVRQLFSLNQNIDGSNMTENGDDAYKQAGVDIAAGDALVSRISPAAKATARAGTGAALGGFGAAFDLKAAGYSDPILVAATDGVGTKLLIAETLGDHKGIGTDLVAMCVNDLATQGAEPLFFLDYFATGKLDVDQASEVIEGIATGCKLAGCALIGGETAEMPGVYPVGRYDLAGFAVGAVERGGFVDGTTVQEGDAVLAIPSSGVHSNGYSLVRRVVEISGLNYYDPAPFAPEKTLGAALLTPTRIYAREAVAVARNGLAHGMAHITGGGLIENPPRAFPKDLAMEFDLGALPAEPLFPWLAQVGKISAFDMARTFNCGAGLLIYTPADQVDEAIKLLASMGADDVVIGGKIVARGDGPAVRLDGLDRFQR